MEGLTYLGCGEDELCTAYLSKGVEYSSIVRVWISSMGVLRSAERVRDS